MRQIHDFDPRKTARAILNNAEGYEQLGDCLRKFLPSLSTQAALARWLDSHAWELLPPSVQKRAKDVAGMRNALRRKPLVHGVIRALLRRATGRTLYVRKTACNLLAP